MGKPPGDGLLDYFYSSIGLTYDCSDDTSITVAFDNNERESTAENVDNDASIELSHKLSQSWNIDLTGLGGLSTAAPDVELTASLSYKF